MGYLETSKTYTLTDAARMIGMDRGNLSYYVRKGKNPPPFEQIGERYYFDIDKLREWYRTTRHCRRNQS
ncbi:MerR family transcriptional regulator [Gemmata sp. G18]|uniref:MerR family transcriptional regulator n=1 Tax=Gemmata palustris TaxID=2822762 RepID=A0ABS5BYP7_9BACT|nr:MerR family transcriptional regulator [Gemmata palustris]MBP3958370.1 MerR family transcriptional regulator [Gemmata palustris]